jgi:hypothetical protein
MSDDLKAQRERAGATSTLQGEPQQMSQVMITCTESGEGVPAGLTIDAASFETSNPTGTVVCPHCGQEHTWSAKDAWIEDVY